MHGIRGAADDRGVQFFKFIVALGEFRDFGWTNEREVERVEECHKPSAFEIRKPKGTEGAIGHQGLHAKVGGHFSNMRRFGGTTEVFIATGHRVSKLWS